MRVSLSSSAPMRSPAVASAVLHASVLVVAFLGLPNLFSRPPPIEPEPVMVEFEVIDKKAAAPKLGNPPPQPKDAVIAEETSKAPPPKSTEPPPAPPKPVQQALVQPPPPPPPPKPVEQVKPEPPKPAEDVVALKPKEPEPPKVEKPPEPPKPAPEVKKPDPPKPPPPPRPPTQKSADSVVDDILKNQAPSQVRTPENAPKPPPQVTRQAAAAPQLAAVVTASEVEGVRSKVRECWFVPGASKEAPIVTMVVQMKQDGTPVNAQIRDTGRYNNDAVFRATADQAWRAVMNPKCHPWPLSPEKFVNWRTITFNFDPRDY